MNIYNNINDNEQIDDDELDDNKTTRDYIINAFGRCEDGKSVYAKIQNFTPYFYIILPDNLMNKTKKELDKDIEKMEEYLKSKENSKINKKFKKTLKELQLIKSQKADGFTNYKEFWFIRLIFTNYNGMKKFRQLFEDNKIYIPDSILLKNAIQYKLYEANLPPMLRCFHIREISGCAWVQTNNYNLIEDEDIKESRCDIEIHLDWRHLNPIKKDINAPLRIASFDIETNSIDGEFPQAKRLGDNIIQIGITYTKLGQHDTYDQYIGCLKQTDKFDDITRVECFENEKDLLEGFIREINTKDCDIITGYNIFFFDEKYMYDRAKLLKMDRDISFISKLKSHKSQFKEMKLASSAMGENLLRFWDTPGRIHIDLMKDIQKTFNLPSYKLDNVASKFIRGEVIKSKVMDDDIVELECKSTDDILVGDYIHLEVSKGFVSDIIGHKYNVISLDKKAKKIIIKADNILKNELLILAETPIGSIYWSQAKDDVGPKDIFRLFKGTSTDRAIVAKYCVKDCKLVSLLMNKLEVVTKNLEMANVCFVPLGYLFIRGQGIKLFSLCLREFRKFKIIFPVIKKDKYYECKKCKRIY
jgi:DNA polymerase elongation subunit (family B)